MTRQLGPGWEHSYRLDFARVTQLVAKHVAEELQRQFGVRPSPCNPPQKIRIAGGRKSVQ